MVLAGSLTSPQQIILCLSGLLGNIDYLRSVLSRDVLDYSAVHVASQWLSVGLRDAQHQLDDVVRHVTELTNIMSLTNGVGLAEIWAELSHHTTKAHDLVRLSELSTSLQSLSSAQQGE